MSGNEQSPCRDSLCETPSTGQGISRTTDCNLTSASADQSQDSTSPSRDSGYTVNSEITTVGVASRYSHDDLELAKALMSSFTKAGGRKEPRGRDRARERVS